MGRSLAIYGLLEWLEGLLREVHVMARKGNFNAVLRRNSASLLVVVGDGNAERIVGVDNDGQFAASEGLVVGGFVWWSLATADQECDNREQATQQRLGQPCLRDKEKGKEWSLVTERINALGEPLSCHGLGGRGRVLGNVAWGRANSSPSVAMAALD